MLISKLPRASHIPLAEQAAAFLTHSPDPFHAVHNAIQRLHASGFQGLNGSHPWTGTLQAGGKYYYTVEHSTLVAFTVGPTFQPGQPFGFHMIGGHTDSPTLKIKPRSKKNNAVSGCTMLAVECYGGGLWHTWFDRDLSVSGRVLIRSSSTTTTTTTTTEGEIQQRLVKLTDPIARISTLCIHLRSAEDRDKFIINKEDHTAPILATHRIVSEANQQAKAALEEGALTQINSTSTTTTGSAWRDGHEPLLLQAIAENLKIDVEDILDFELNLYDTQPAALGGIAKEFLYSARLDNLATVFCATEAICHHAETDTTSSDVSVMVAFDHEEVGSQSAQGAGSPVMKNAIERISAALNGGSISPDLYSACIRQSFILSVDQAHAVHPNFASKHDPSHAPQLNAGVVIKTNNNQRYTTNGLTGFMVRELGRIANVPIQEYMGRNDCPCGTTIGPVLSALTGIRSVDAGMPQLSMHSCREVMGVVDLYYGIELFKTFYSQFRALDTQLSKQIEA